jgi:Fe-S-cluster-containing dehydrogenase component/formate-dependent nitrite reductase membrane component NrfD
MQYGFVIDHSRCIGCHACTVACKAENDVPVASFRTWVKYAEKGRFPAVKRHFAVLRCNHCTAAPCVTICPVTALSKRKDGIVDLDRDACIGCRACMQGCPYDAIYLNEDSGSAEKCHYCAHRTERGLEPACVIVCPEGAIISGDLHDKESRIAKIVAQGSTLVRRADQGTGPNVHYVDVEPSLLEPGTTERPEMYLWSDRPPHKREPWPEALPLVPDVRVVLDAGHKVEWGWHVAAYLVTKGIAAGAALLAPFADALGLTGFARDFAPEIIALVFTLITTYLLVVDLARPKLFLTLLTRPNTRSWLVKGAWILIAFSITVPITIALHWLGWGSGHGESYMFTAAGEELRWLNALLGLGVAGYTAFLFQQCEGRDLWQSKALLPHLLVQALMLGAAVLAPLAANPRELLAWLGAALILHGGFMTFGKQKLATENARQAAAFLPVIRLGPIARPYKLSIVIGTALPAFFVAIGNLHRATPILPVLACAAALCTIGGLYLYEYCYIRAGQLPPLS